MSKEEPHIYTGLEGITCVYDWRVAPTDRIAATGPSTKPKTRLSKHQQTINALDTPAERRKKRDTRHYKNSVSFDPDPQGSADKTQRIKGRL